MASNEEHDFSERDDERRWQDFARKHPGHAALMVDTLYALPLRCVRTLEETGFLNKEEAEFERDLSQAAGFGFFLSESFDYLRFAAERGDYVAPPADPALLKSQENIQEMLAEDLLSKGVSPTEIDQYFTASMSETAGLLKRRRAYAGWLLLSKGFRNDRDRFVHDWRQRVVDEGYFQSFPSSFMGELGDVPETECDYTDAFIIFYSKWGLDRMVTWDLPSPMYPELASPNFYYKQKAFGAGINIFLPLYLLRDKQLKLEEVIRLQQRVLARPEIRPWLEHVPKSIGYEQLALVPEIYLVIELCLKRRYPDRLHRNLETIELAISHVREGPGDEAERYKHTVKKVRLYMQRCLNVQDTQ